MRVWFRSKEHRLTSAYSSWAFDRDARPSVVAAAIMHDCSSRGQCVCLSVFSLRTLIITYFCGGSESGFQKLTFLSPIVVAPKDSSLNQPRAMK